MTELVATMLHRLSTQAGKNRYRMMGWRQMSMRGLRKA
ncbi:hypothetical protein J2W36_004421 [Variovorax ginsengisoli]|uniref:Uncharacterized protein n=1 Tax=Variovorax ginsengisoli TaxID=363844 RepID=A0ABT9SCS8_9BURK|nr:hypothetical protein [Variovorax ginsengisoli]